MSSFYILLYDKIYLLLIDCGSTKIILIMKDYQVELKKIIEEKKHLVDQQFTNIVEYICENIVSYELLDLVLKYLEIYPQQISLIPKSNLYIKFFSFFVRYSGIYLLFFFFL